MNSIGSHLVPQSKSGLFIPLIRVHPVDLRLKNPKVQEETPCHAPPRLHIPRDLDKSIPTNMVTHMKTTIEIADNLLARAQHITLRSLIEESLAATLDQPLPAAMVSPVTFKGNGLSREFEDASWDKIHDARIASICQHHGVKKLWSADRDFTSFPELVCENPLIP